MDKTVRFEEVTNKDDRITECLVNNYGEWGPPLSLDDYLTRERQLHEIHIRNGLEHRSFALVHNESDKVIAACETLNRPLYHGGANFSKDNCIASVFVVPEYRQGGYCKTLINSVVELYNESSSDHQMSLWSDIGDYYTRVGFSFPPSFQGEPQWNRSFICTGTSSGRSECDFLTADETLAQIVPEHQRLLRRDADALYHDCQGEINISVVIPHMGLYEQLQFRAIYTAEKLGIRPPKHFAARSPDGHGWITWTYMFASKKLLVLGIFGSANEIALLISAAIEAAHKYDCKLELYESSIVEPLSGVDEVVAALNTVKIETQLIERTTSLPMSMGPGIWVFQGGYAWY